MNFDDLLIIFERFGVGKSGSCHIEVSPRGAVSKAREKAACRNSTGRVYARIHHIRVLRGNGVLIFWPQWERPAPVVSLFTRFNFQLTHFQALERC